MLDNCLISGFSDEIDEKLDAQIVLLHRLGQNYIEFRAADGVGVARHTLEQAKEVKTRLDAAGIKVSSLGSPIGKIGITDDFEPHFELFKHVVDIAGIMDTKYIRMFSFYIPQGEDPLRYEDEVFSRLEKMIAYAKEKGVVLLHENEKGIFGDNADRCLRLMKRFYGESFRCVFDFANFVQCNQNTWEAYELLKDYITYIHVKDALFATGEVVVPGTGDGELERIFTALEKDGFMGFLSLEPHLADFPGLAELEKDPAKRGLSDGAKAYMLAHEGLMKIIG